MGRPLSRASLAVLLALPGIAGCECGGSPPAVVAPDAGDPVDADVDPGDPDDAGPDAGDGGAGTDAGTCTETCEGATRFCDPVADRCVACLVDDHCEDRRRSRCQEDRTCGPCTADGQCKEVDFPDCDEIQDGGSGVCVECTPGNDARYCGAFACDGETQRCTRQPARSVPRCGGCRASLECATEGDGCVGMTFDGATLADGYCLGPAEPGCARPTPRTSPPRAILGGDTPRSWCAVDEGVTSCAALGDFEELCDGDGDCGEGLGDGVCERGPAGVGRCRSRCVNDDDCPLTATCEDDGVCRPPTP